MAAVTPNWIHFVGFAVLLCGAAGACYAETGASAARAMPDSRGQLAGKLTDLYARAVEGATVVARNEATGEEVRTTTTKHGTYLFSALRTGKYTLEAETASFGRGHLEGIQVDAGHTQRLVTAMSFNAAPQTDLAAVAPSSPTPMRQTLARQTLDGKALAGQTPQKFPASRETSADPFASGASQFAQDRTQAPRLPQRATEAPAVEPTYLAATLALEPFRALAPTERSLPVQASLSEAAHLASATGPLRVPATGSESIVSVNLAVSVTPQPRRSLHAFVPVDLPEAISGASRRDPVAEEATSRLNANQIQALPGAERPWQDFAMDAPPVNAAGDRRDSQRGEGLEQADVGTGEVDQKLAFAASGSSGFGAGIGAQTWPTGGGHGLSEAAVRQVEVLAGNPETASSGAAGRPLDAPIERGFNGWHGQGFLSDRQNVWGAQNPFAQWVKESTPAAATSVAQFAGIPFTPPDHEIVWSIGVGRHTKHDRFYWFGAWNSSQRNDPGLSTVKHPDQFFAQPTNDQLQVLSARLGLSNANPLVEGASAYSGMLETLDGLLGPSIRTATQWAGFGRVDWEATERNRFALEGTGADRNAPGGGFTRTIEPFGNHSFGSAHTSQKWLLGRWERFGTPNLLFVTQASVGREVRTAQAQTPSLFEQTLLAGNDWGQLPQIAVGSSAGFTMGNPARFGHGDYPNERLYEGTEALNWVHGDLLARAGLQANHNGYTTSLLRNQTGSYSYASVENLASDALSFAKFGTSGQLDPYDQHNCDQTGKTWRDAAGTLHGLGYLPCYSYFSQMLGPADWNLSTNDWAAYSTLQWQPKKPVIVSAGVRWEREQMPPPIASLDNPNLPLTQKLPSTGNQWGPKVGIAFGQAETHWPVLRLGYGLYFGRTENATLETVLTRTGSLAGDLNYFIRPTDNLQAGGAPPFPNVLNGAPGSVVKPGAVEFAPGFRNPEIQQAVAAVEEKLPLHVTATVSASLSLGRLLPFVVDTNFDPAVNPKSITYAVIDPSGLGPIKTPTITVPFYASWPSANATTGFAGRLNPGYQQIAQISSRANSTYESITMLLTRTSRHGLSAHAHYTYSHAMDWNPNDSAQVSGSDPLDPANFKMEYGSGDLDTRHAMAASLVYEAPWRLNGLAGQLANGWMASTILRARSGEPYSMHTEGSLAKEFLTQTGTAIVALAPGMNGSGGDNRVYGVGRNTYRYPVTWKMDMRLARRFNLGPMRALELLAESFNLMNHENVTELESVGYTIESGSVNGTLPTLTFLNGVKANTTAFGQPLNVNATNFYRERQLQFGVRLNF